MQINYLSTGTPYEYTVHPQTVGEESATGTCIGTCIGTCTGTCTVDTYSPLTTVHLLVQPSDVFAWPPL